MTRRFALASALALASATQAATPELRGVWVTTTGLSTGDVKTAALTTTNFANFRNVGLNTVYMDVLRNGDTYFRSNTMKAITGRDLATELTSGGTNARGDLFGETLIQSHRNGMAQFAWLQYGFATQYQPTLDATGKPLGNALTNYMSNKGWLLKNSVGTGAAWDSTNNFAWMNPLVPEVRKFIIDMGVELVTKYDVDGVQFDDRLAWPTNFGFNDPTIKAAYESETSKLFPTALSGTAFNDFTTWRSQKITAFAQEFSTAIRKANPNVLVAAAPGGYGDTYAKYAADAPAWSRSTVTVNGVTMPTFDEITPQIYNSNADNGANFGNTFNNDVNAMDQSHLGDYGVGIALTNGTTIYNWNTVSQPQINAQRNRAGTKGHIFWYSPGVLADAAQLTAYYNVSANGQASRPDQAAGWRPPPVVGTGAGAGLWNVTTTPLAERYQVIARTGDKWAIVLNTVLPAGTLTLNTGGAYAAVELLVDRRGFIAGDANFGRVVNFDDLVLLAQNYNASNRLWTQGDFTLDGVVNFDDLIIMAQHYNTGVPANEQMSFAEALELAGLVPEPTLATAIASCAVLKLRRRK